MAWNPAGRTALMGKCQSSTGSFAVREFQATKAAETFKFLVILLVSEPQSCAELHFALPHLALRFLQQPAQIMGIHVELTQKIPTALRHGALIEQKVDGDVDDLRFTDARFIQIDHAIHFRSVSALVTRSACASNA